MFPNKAISAIVFLVVFTIVFELFSAFTSPPKFSKVRQSSNSTDLSISNYVAISKSVDQFRVQIKVVPVAYVVKVVEVVAVVEVVEVAEIVSVAQNVVVVPASKELQL